MYVPASSELVRHFACRSGVTKPLGIANGRLTPELSYGRHFGPAPASARQAAVMLLVYPHEGQWFLPLTVRPDTLADHAGQVSLPGGAVDSGETSEACALRELEEELGIAATGIEMLGTLSPLWVFVSNFLVTPHVAMLDERPLFVPNEAEVAELIEFPLSALFDPSIMGSHLIIRRSLRFRAPHFAFGRHQIWGATCLMLGEFAAALTDLA